MRFEDKAILSTWIEYLNSLKLDSSLVNLSLKHDPHALSVMTGIKENLYNSVFINSPMNDSAVLQELPGNTARLKSTINSLDIPSDTVSSN